MDLAEITAILADPREDLRVEIKQWLDLEENYFKAKIAKEVIALANHGGGIIINGLAEQENGTFQHHPDDNNWRRFYTADYINGFLKRYTEPPLHCDVRDVKHPSGKAYPVIIVQGGHPQPIMAKSGSPDDARELQPGQVYIRRIGAASEAPKSAAEWQALLRRCIMNNKQEMLNAIRDIVTGDVAQQARQSEAELLDDWLKDANARWHHLVRQLPEEAPARMPYGRWEIGFKILDDVTPPTLPDLLSMLQTLPQFHPTRPVWWCPAADDIKPQPRYDMIECWAGRDVAANIAPVYDFWRADPYGRFFLTQGYKEDDSKDYAPGTVFDVFRPVQSLAAALYHVKNITRQLLGEDGRVIVTIRFTGLAGRRLECASGSYCDLDDQYVCRQTRYIKRRELLTKKIESNLPEQLLQFLSPLYAYFDFYRLEMDEVIREIRRVREG